jgi:hypothetical protein
VAKPDCDDGWYKKSIELEAALGYADFTKLAQTLLRYVFCQIFGQGDRPRTAVLNCSEIAARMKKPRQHVFRALQELVASKVLVPVGGREDTYRFVKDYEKWKLVARLKGSFFPTDRPRLDPAEVADCLDAPDYSRGFVQKRHVHESVINRDDNSPDAYYANRDDSNTSEDSVINLDDKTEVVINLDDKSEKTNGTLSSIEMTNCHQSRLQTVINLDDKTVPPYVPPIRKEIENREAEKNSRACAEELEPFMSPPNEEPPPPAKADPLEAKIHSHALERTTSPNYPAGREDMAEHAVSEYRLWVKQGYSRAVVKDAIKKTFSFGDDRSTNALRFSGYLQGTLTGIAQRMTERASPPPPPPPNHSTLRKPTESLHKPAPPGGDVKGTRP